MSESQNPDQQNPAPAGKLVICPYCGEPQPTSMPSGAVNDVNERCRSCAGLFEPLSRQATHNAMGPWFVRDPQRPFQPGCSYETLVRLVQRGKITRLSIVRGPTTRQFWTIAKRVQGIAHLLGFCHECGASVDPGDHGCHACGVSFGAFLDRNYLGLPEYRPLPWERDANSDDPRQAMGLTADDPSGRTWHGLPIIRESPRQSRLSAFATDEELRSNGGPPVGAAAIPAAAPLAETAGPAEAEPPAQPRRNDATQRDQEVTIRLLRRRSGHQQKTIQRLTILSTALAFMALIALIGWVATAIDGAERRGTPAVAEQDASQEAGDETAPPDPAAPDELDPIDEPEEPLLEPAIIEEPVIEEPAVIDPARLAAVQEEFDRALALVRASRQEDRALADAIADCEEAIAILTRILDKEPAALHPLDLEDRLAEARRHHERLKLREFFP